MAALKPTVSLALIVGWLGLAGTEARAHVISAPSNSFNADALLNLSAGPYDSQGSLTTDNPLPWWDSSVVNQFYGGVPNDQQKLQFSNAIITMVQKTFAQSGVPLTLTNNPNDPVPHAISVVSNASYPGNPNAAGIANIGGSGFTFIDQFVYAKTLNQLEWAVAHNVAHELMHDFGVDHHDTSGQYLDSGVTDWTTLVDPNAVFSPAAVSDLLGHNFRVPEGLSWYNNGAEMIGSASDASTFAAPVPEPSTLALWAAGGVLLMAFRTRRRAA